MALNASLLQEKKSSSLFKKKKILKNWKIEKHENYLMYHYKNDDPNKKSWIKTTMREKKIKNNKTLKLKKNMQTTYVPQWYL